MFCKNCGAQVQDGVAFCGVCGAQMEAPVAASPQYAPVADKKNNLVANAKRTIQAHKRG